ncbi:glutamate [NMDA] receptor subunit 1-like [Rhopilema esculentum]|uniref:glutamate [NMDA] receptor subunit 1-like n=1 Tax=Rhopilema esculentum TaxID=499914 RepID=UPI0031E365E9
MQPEKHSHSTSKDEDLESVVRVVIASTYSPWVIVEEICETHITGRKACGLIGMLGEKYVNGTNTVKICVYGYAIDLLNRLRKNLNFEAVIYTSRDGRYGSYDLETGETDGIRDSFDESSIFGPFSDNLWFGIIGLIAGLVVTIYITEHVSPYSGFQIKKRSFDDIKDFGAFDSTTYVWGTLFTGEIIEKKPKSSGSRTMVLAFSFVSVVIISAYSGNLITYLVVLDERPPVSGLFVPKLIGNVKTMTVGILESSYAEGFLKAHSDSRVKNLYNRVKLCNSLEDCIKRLKKKEIDLLVQDGPTLRHLASTLNYQNTTLQWEPSHAKVGHGGEGSTQLSLI